MNPPPGCLFHTRCPFAREAAPRRAGARRRRHGTCYGLSPLAGMPPAPSQLAVRAARTPDRIRLARLQAAFVATQTEALMNKTNRR